MEKKTIIIIASCIAAILLIIALLFFFVFSHGNSKRDNIIKLINRYYDQEEYDRALKFCEDLLIENPDDQEVLDLQDKIIKAKNQKALDEENAKSQKEQEDKQKLIDAMNQLTAEKRNETPIIITRNNDNNSDRENESLSKAEKEKKDKIDKLIDEGLREFNSQNYARAKSKFLEALKFEDDNAEANAYLGMTLYNENPKDQGNIKEAINKIKKALKKDNTLDEAHYTLAKIYDDQGAYDLAIDEYKETIKLNPQNYEAFNALGKIYYRQKEYEKAETQFAAAIRIKNDFVQGYFNIATTQNRLNKKSDSKKNYKKAIDLDPTYFGAVANLGNLYFYEQDYENALTYFLKAVKLDDRYKYRELIGESYMGLNQPDNAIDAFSASIAINPKQTDEDKEAAVQAYIYIADIEKNRGHFKESLDYVNKGMALDNRNPTLYNISGYDKNKLGNNDAAIEDYKKTISLDPGYIYAYINLSKLYNEVGQYDDAIKTAQKGISVDRKQYQLYNNLGDSLQKNKDYREAISVYKNGISLNPSVQDMQFNLGLCYKATDDNDNAVNAFKQVIKLNGNNYDAYYELGESYFLLKRFDESRLILNTLIKKKPDYSRKDDIDKMLTAMN